MIGRGFVTVTLLIAMIACSFAAPKPSEDGKYHPEFSSGRYVASDEGRYVHKTYPYVHTDDFRDLGKYHHIHIPYDGGYGPYSGTNIPYRHDDNGAYSQIYQVSTLDLNPESFDIPRPDILLEYGFPDHIPSSTPASAIKRSIDLAIDPAIEPALEPAIEPALEPAIKPALEPALEPAIEPTLEPAVEPALASSTIEPALEPAIEATLAPAIEAALAPAIEAALEPAIESTPKVERKKRSIATNAKHQSILAILPIRYITADINDDDEYGVEPSKFLVDSQPTTTTTERPRVRYLDEGKWRIIRQEEEKRSHKYDYLYLTENGIYAEEQAKLRDEGNRATGTNSKGYYEYPGDDGKIYMVHYTVGEQGFVPMGDHIPTTPPVPHAIQRALDYVAAKKSGTLSKRF